jgi:hypothetical protein
LFLRPRYRFAMPDAAERLITATQDDLADAIAFALRFNGRKRVYDANEGMAGRRY